jgi:hypothetical protein
MAVLRRFIIAYDSHGDQADEHAVAAFKEFCKWWKPTIKIHGGDAFDLRCLRGGASAEEKQEGLKADVECGMDFLRWFKPDYFLLGNHDYRLVRAAQSAGNQTMREYCSLLLDQIADGLPGTKIIPYGKRQGVLKLGDYRIIHGYHSGIYAARMAAQLYGNVIMGHIHTPTYFENPHIDGSTGYSSGSLCQMDMDYNIGHPNTLRQAHGWIYGLLTAREKLIPYASKCVDGQWYLPSEFREVRHG